MIRKYNYRCLNSDCKEKFVKVWRDSGDINTPEPCPTCEVAMKLMGEEYNCLALFSSKSSEEKKEIIRKRAAEHTRTKMKDRVHEVRKRILKGE